MGKSIRSKVKKHWRSELRQRVGKPYERVQNQIIQNNLQKTLRGEGSGKNTLSVLRSAMGGQKAMEESSSDEEGDEADGDTVTRLDHEGHVIAKQGGLGASCPSKDKSIQFSHRYRSYNNESTQVSADLKPRFSFAPMMGVEGDTIKKTSTIVIKSVGQSQDYESVIHTEIPLEQLGMVEGQDTMDDAALKKKKKTKQIKSLPQGATYEYGAPVPKKKGNNFITFHPQRKKGTRNTANKARKKKVAE